MNGMGNAVARRDGSAPAVSAPAALAIQAGQLTWDKFQDAALNQLGLREAGNGDRAVFLHVCQRTGLDPFARQIYMIGRPEEVDGKWTKKWTIQTGIEGWRVIRDRAEKREKVRGVLGRAVWYDDEGTEHKVWVQPGPPTACEITYTVRDAGGTETPYTSVLMFREYVQTKKDGKPTQMWTVKGVHMLEKCVEADVYRKAFPQDFSGVYLDDAMPPPDPDAPDRLPSDRPRVTAEQARARTVTATVVTPEPSPAAPDAPVSGPAVTIPAEVAAAGEAQHLKTGPEYIAERLEKLGVTGVVRTAGRLTGRQLADLDELTDAEAVTVMRTLSTCKTAADLDGVLAELELASDPRGEDGDGGQ
jgi:phage recombination protein Bet